MVAVLLIDNVKFSAAGPQETSAGLIGWVALTVNGLLRLDGLALRRTTDGRLVLSFPARRDGAGRQHFYVRPLDDVARRDIERQVFQALGLEEGAKR